MPPKRKRNGYINGYKVSAANLASYRRSKIRRRGLYAAVAKQNIRTGGFASIENKFIDVELDATAFATTWSTMEPATEDALSAVAQGDGESNRDGRIYHINGIFIQGHFAMPASESNNAPVSDQECRIALVLDTQTNAAQLTATDVMDGGQTKDYHAFRNLQFTKRFRVLKDKKVVLNVENTNEGAINLFANKLVVKNFKINHTFKPPLRVICKGTTAVIASITDNSLHLIGVGSSTTSQLNYQCRLRFTG